LAAFGVKAVSRARRRFLGLLIRFSRGNSDPTTLLDRFPAESLMPLRRVGLDPVTELGQLRERDPVSRLKMPLGLRAWLVTGYEESKAVLAADPDTFSNDFVNMVGKLGVGADQDPGGLGFADPPAHTRLRHLLTPHFTTRALARRAPRVRQIVDDALAEVAHFGEDGATVDLQAHFALPIPSRVIMELLGIEDSDREEFRRLSSERFDFTRGAGSLDVIAQSVDYLQGIVARQRKAPGAGLIGSILAEHGDDIDDVELAGLADGVLTGGLETTVSMLSLGAVVLLRDPAAFAALRDDDASVDPFVEELLRYLTVVQVGFPRFARRDVTLGTQKVLAGDAILCSLSGANRDARHGSDLDRVDPTRAPIGHLAFGYGLHRCIGAELARMELRLAYPALVRRFPGLRLAVAPEELAYRQLSFVYGLEQLPVTLG
jgi:cytochrome P450